jgi:aminoglycoside phosphotransferase (APT) family kinase protein
VIPSWLQTIMRLIRPELPKDFVGQVEVNVFKGGISNVTVKQSFKEEEKTK